MNYTIKIYGGEDQDSSEEANNAAKLLYHGTPRIRLLHTVQGKKGENNLVLIGPNGV